MLAAFILSAEGPNTELGWLLWIAFGFFALIVIIGWLTSRGEASGPTAPAQDELRRTPPPKKTSPRGQAPPANTGRQRSK
jgi:hypothetical protein